MQQFHQLLPQLDLLTAFEAAARHESFTLAAQEMNVTQSAVSQRIRQLEERMGVALFERHHRAVRLTREGADFQNSVTVALNHLVAASDAVKATAADTRMHLVADVALTHFWLMPRLASLSAALPDVAIDITASDTIEEAFIPSTDVAIVHGDGDWPGFRAVKIFGEVVFPVCSPGYLGKYGPVETLDDLGTSRLVDLSYERWSWMNWAIWMTETGGPRTGANRVFQSNSYAAVIDAARSGMGIALGWQGFVEDDLDAGRLVVPLDRKVATRYGYYAVVAQDRIETPIAQAFLNWVAQLS